MKNFLLSIVLFTLSISCSAQEKNNYNWEGFDFSNNQPSALKQFANGFRIHSVKNELTNNILIIDSNPIFGLQITSFNDLNCSFCTFIVTNQFNNKEKFEMQLTRFNPFEYHILDKPKFLKFISSGKFTVSLNNSNYLFKPLNNISTFSKPRDFSYWTINDQFLNTVYPSLNISYSQFSFNVFPKDTYSIIMLVKPANTELSLAVHVNEINFSCGQICNLKINTAGGSFEVPAYNFANNTNSPASYVIVANPTFLFNKIKSLNQNSPTFSITVPTIEKGNLTFKFNISEYWLYK